MPAPLCGLLSVSDYLRMCVAVCVHVRASTAGAIGHLSLCRAKKSDVYDSLSSFPSGHASAVFAGLGFLAWFFYGIYRAHPDPQRVKPQRVSFLPVPLIQLVWAVCCFAAVGTCVFVAVSRTRDYK